MDKSHGTTAKKATATHGAEKGTIRVVSVYTGTMTASEAFHSAAVKKVLYDRLKQ